MRKNILLSLCAGALFCSCAPEPPSSVEYRPAIENNLRAPAYPLVTVDPYLSLWSFSNRLNDEETRHWTGRNFPVVGGIRVDGVTYRFMGRDQVKTESIIPLADHEVWDAVYTFDAPKGNWMDVSYSADGWKKGKAAFGTPENPKPSVAWENGDIWVRRTFDWPADVAKEDLFIQYSHDDNVEVYLNGVKVAVTGNGLDYNLLQEIPAELAETIKPTGNILAAHCRNNGGGAYLDFGIAKQIKEGDTFDVKAEQTSVTVTPTQTFYTFRCGGIELDFIFTSPALTDDLEFVAAPYNYLTYQVHSADGAAHDVQLYLEATPVLAVNTVDQKVTFSMNQADGMHILKTGTVEQPILEKSGDDVRIDWGYLCLAVPQASNATVTIGEQKAVKREFLQSGKLSNTLGEVSEDITKQMTVLAYADNLGRVSKNLKSGHILLGYDDIYSIQYFGENLRPYWNRSGNVSIEKMLKQGFDNYASVMSRCADFDKKLYDEAKNAGGEQYAELCALVYRQVMAAHKLVVDSEGNNLFFSKENFSNGSIGTVDITYPSSPMFLCYNVELLKGMMNPIFYYSESGKWTKPFAAHDVGTYPKANGQTYGGDMPVEESGNMLILAGAIASVEKNADYAARHWDVLTTWVDYLRREGLDPANQLCTDDFAGHFAHNTNLSIKAIMGVASYAKLASMLGKDDVATEYMNSARDMAAKWSKMAKDAGGQYRLTFDQPGTWSQKYNLIWDRLLGFNLFDDEIFKAETNFYLKHINTYGLPLDNRADYTKSDWIMWSACLVDDANYFEAMIAPVWKYANTTTSRVPLSDWHFTSTGDQRGFQARSVVGGYYMKVLQKRLGQ